MNKKLKSLLIILLIALPLIAGYFSYAWAYKSSAIISYDKGLKNGFIEGNSTGYSLGYELGFNGGNSSGYELGFNVGFAEGNRIGYVQGYEIGCNDGNSSGYGIGYAEGLDDGVKSGFIEGNVSGYSLSYDDGNFSGYETGYNFGYEIGNSSGYASGNLSGYGIGYNFGYTDGLNDGAGSGFTVRNPTYQEMQNFIVADQTEQNSYIYPTYVCWNFAGDVKNNAFTVGFRCGFVYVSFPDSAHVIVCFETIDQGLVFIEPQDDSIMSLVIGQHYWDRSKYIVDYDDTVVRYGIIW